MLLNTDNLYHYLAQRKLVSEENCVNGHFMAYQVPNARNTIFKVHGGGDSTLFVKQSSAQDVYTNILKREAQAYQLVHSDPSMKDFVSSVPLLYDYDEESHTLITELKKDTLNLNDYYLSTKHFPVELGIEQARCLAGLHHKAPIGAEIKTFPYAYPWILRINEFNAFQLFPDNMENGKLIQLIQKDDFLRQSLENLKLGWVQTHLIHGDVKWVNFLVQAQPTYNLFLVDWELADMGDPCWDIAGLIQSYLAAWIFGFNNRTPSVYILEESLRPFELNNMQASINVFLEHYSRLREMQLADVRPWVTRVMQYTAARILQTSIEGVVHDPAIQPNNMRCIQLAYNIFKNPLGSIEYLLGYKL